jgi:hypothetical protein
VDDLDQTLGRLREAGDAIVIGEPAPARAINNRRVAYVVTTTVDLFEFVEAVLIIDKECRGTIDI